MSVLSLRNVTKRFGDFTAVEDLSFEAAEGKVLGFLGRNGAGKTTTLRMVLDILRPTSGEIVVLGHPPGREDISRTGFLPEERGLYRRMTVLDTIIYFGQLKGMTARAARASAQDLVSRFDLESWSGKLVERLSKGMAQKVQLAGAIVNAPKLVLLDEPFSGLDPVSQTSLEDTILDLARSGSTVVFSTHVMQHAERLCDRLVVLSHGRKVFDGAQKQAAAILPTRLQLTARGDPSGLAMVAEAKPQGPAEDGWTAWQVVLRRGADPGDLLEACFAQGLVLRQFEERRPSLHDIFIHLAGDEPVATEQAA